MNWRRELGNLVREVVSHGVYDFLSNRKSRFRNRRGEAGTTLHRLFDSLKQGVKNGNEALQNSLHDTARRVKEKARNAKQKGGYK